MSLSLLTSVMAAVFESLPGKLLALLNTLSYLCRYRPSPSPAIYLAKKLYLLPCGRKCPTIRLGSIAVIVKEFLIATFGVGQR